jgi:PAS domain S-box-containing protein
MSTDQQHTSKSWGHRLRQENRGLREKIAQLKKESNVFQKELRNTWKLISNVPAALFLVQQEKIVFANETACRELGYTLKEIFAKTFPDLLHPDSISFATGLQQKRPMDQILPGQNEIFLTAKSGQTLCYEVRVNKIRYQGKTAFLLNMLNLDQRKAHEKRLGQSVKTEALVRMASGFSRELENSMILLGEHIQEIQGPESLDNRLLRSLGRIEAVREKGSFLSNHLNCLTRTEYDPSEITLLDLKKVLKKAVNISHPKWTAGSESNADNIKIKTYLRALSPIYGCKRELEDVFVNIILNAIEAMPGEGEIYLTTEEHSGLAHIYFQDNGTGISDGIIDKIFDPFFTTKDGARRGLGLTLAYAIIGRHEGDIRVTSNQGLGSTFLVKLPLAGKAPLLKGKTKKKGLKDSRILIIGEGRTVIDILYQLLTSKGSTSAIASSRYESLKLLRGNKFDLVIADQNAPHIETSKMIREIKRLHPDLPVALINARGNPETRDVSIKIGADLTIGRPLDIDRLLSLLSNLLANEVPH